MNFHQALALCISEMMEQFCGFAQANAEKVH